MSTLRNKIHAIHCINQFFGGLGGEEQAGLAPQFFAGAKGPGLLIEKTEPRIEIVGTIVFGDNYVAEHTETSVEEIIELINLQVASRQIETPELLLAGPAFNAGRYGLACGAVCKAAQQQLQVSATTAMFVENPGVDAYRRYVTIAKCGANVMDMKSAVESMSRVALKLVQRERIVPDIDNTIPHGLRENYFAEQTGAQRALNMLMKKLRGEPFATEYAMPDFDRVPAAPAVLDATHAKLALVTSGGIVPRGNPDRIPSASAQCYGEYSLEGITRLSAETHQTVHGGYDPTYANEDPNRVLPVDVVRELETEGRIGEVYPQYFATVGNATSVENAKRFGEEIAAKLVNDGVQAVILTSTWGTCTRCGATMVKELERAGLPTVHVCSIVPISMTVGANRIVPSIAIPHPLGEPAKSPTEEKRIRRALVELALEALQTEITEQHTW